MRVGGLFSGIGGMERAAELAGFEIAYHCEINPDCHAVLHHHFPYVPLFTDITELNGTHLPPVDLLCGGFPCQDVSVAGRRAGLAGKRSVLFFEFTRIIKETNPRWFVIENVPGLLSSNDGRDFGTVLGTLAELGYGFAWRVLDARHFGVPQRRRRVVIVGCAGEGTGAGEVLFDGESLRGDSKKGREAGEGVAALTANGVGTCGADDNQGQAGHLIPVYDPAPCLTSRYAKGIESDADDGMVLAFSHTQGLNPQISRSAYPTLRAGGGGQAVAYNPYRTQLSPGEWVEGWKPDPIHDALTAQSPPKGRPVVVSDWAVRRLTPTECERLQGFPDNWTDVLKPVPTKANPTRVKPMPDSSRYRMLGNAVAVPVFQWLFRRIALAEWTRQFEEVAA